MRSWAKVSLLAELVKSAGISDIVDRFNAGKLDLFARDEIVALIRTLFADSDTRDSKLRALKVLDKK